MLNIASFIQSSPEPIYLRINLLVWNEARIIWLIVETRGVQIHVLKIDRLRKLNFLNGKINLRLNGSYYLMFNTALLVTIIIP